MLWREPVVVLGSITGAVLVLSQEHIIASWIPLVVLAVVTPIQRALSEPRE